MAAESGDARLLGNFSESIENGLDPIRATSEFTCPRWVSGCAKRQGS